MLILIKYIISARFVSMDLRIVWKVMLVCSATMSNNVVVINSEKYCRGVISSKGSSENSLRLRSQTIVSLFLQPYTHWVGLFAWSRSLELTWLLAPAKEARGVSSSDSAESVGSSSETLLRTASSISSFSSLSELRPKRSDWFPSNI